eukprot:scaffold10_cov257-Pinguiococcus_pyrenoidosus.AAC.60
MARCSIQDSASTLRTTTSSTSNSSASSTKHSSKVPSPSAGSLRRSSFTPPSSVIAPTRTGRPPAASASAVNSTTSDTISSSTFWPKSLREGRRRPPPAAALKPRSPRVLSNKMPSTASPVISSVALQSLFFLVGRPAACATPAKSPTKFLGVAQRRWQRRRGRGAMRLRHCVRGCWAVAGGGMKRRLGSSKRWPSNIIRANNVVLAQVKLPAAERSGDVLHRLWREVKTWLEGLGSPRADFEKHVMSAFVRAFSGLLDSGATPVRQILDIWGKRGHKMDTGTLHSLVMFHVSRGEVEGAFELLQKFRRQGLHPKPATLAAALAAYANEETQTVDFEGAKRFWRMHCYEHLPGFVTELPRADYKTILYLDLLSVTIKALRYGSISLEQFAQHFDELLRGYAEHYSSIPESLAEALCDALEHAKDEGEAPREESSAPFALRAEIVDLADDGTCPSCSFRASQVTLDAKVRTRRQQQGSFLSQAEQE